MDVLRKAQLIHGQSQNEIQYLWDYYRDEPPVMGVKCVVKENNLPCTVCTREMRILR